MPPAFATRPTSVATAPNDVGSRLAPQVLRGVGLPDGSQGDIWLSDGRIDRVAPHSTLPVESQAALDLRGYVVLPSFVEAHAHLDKAYTADIIHNRTGDLLGAIDAWRAERTRFTVDEIAARARRAALRYVQNGTTAIRSHVDTGDDIGLQAINALIEVRAELADLVDVQIVALCSTPVTGAAGADNRTVVRAALDAGADGVGGAAFLDEAPPAALDFLASLADEFDALLDLHVDETTDPNVFTLPATAALVANGFTRPLTASHCVSLGSQDELTQRRTADVLAEHGIGVVTLPQTNLYLQGRHQSVGILRGLTALHALLAAGVDVAGGADNVQDPFNPVGRTDPLEVASLLVAAGHLQPAQALRLLTVGGRAVLGLEPSEIAVGAAADLVAVRARSRRAAVADAPAERIVIRHGEVVAWTRVDSAVGNAARDLSGWS